MKKIINHWITFKATEVVNKTNPDPRHYQLSFEYFLYRNYYKLWERLYFPRNPLPNGGYVGGPEFKNLLSL